MRVYVFQDAQQVGDAAAMIIASQIYEKPNCVLGLATGSTPIPAYQALIDMDQRGLIDFSGVRTFNLDEYVGLAPDHPGAYNRFMDDYLFNHIGIDKANTHVPSGLGDPEETARLYERLIEDAGGIDLQLLGIGHNGHIGFNEPAAEYPIRTHVAELTPFTLQMNSRWFDRPEDIPHRAISLGIGNIMAARRVILLATGEEKAQAIARAVDGPVSPESPSSMLQFHPNAQLLLDEGAASLLEKNLTKN
jgi:glucosamine-6-phosphate deaminase